MKTMMRSAKDRKIAGVCGGLGEYLEVDPVIFRILFVFLIFMGGAGLIIYLILLLVMPEQTIGDEDKVIVIENSTQEVNTEDKSDEMEGSIENADSQHTKPKHHLTSFGSIFGLVLIVLGLFFLGYKYLPALRFDLYFPILIIVGGVLLMLLGRDSNKK